MDEKTVSNRIVSTEKDMFPLPLLMNSSSLSQLTAKIMIDIHKEMMISRYKWLDIAWLKVEHILFNFLSRKFTSFAFKTAYLCFYCAGVALLCHIECVFMFENSC